MSADPMAVPTWFIVTVILLGVSLLAFMIGLTLYENFHPEAKIRNAEKEALEAQLELHRQHRRLERATARLRQLLPNAEREES